MEITRKAWENYIKKLASLNQKASDTMNAYVRQHGLGNRKEIIDLAYSLATKYGEGSSELACEMYDAIAEISGVTVPAAEPAPTATYNETARAVNGSLKQSPTGQLIGQVAGRLVKQAAADTTLKNAKRDGAEWAWIPNGDTCAFCLAIASGGWKPASAAQLKGDHADHIHANCDCEFAIRFNSRTNVAGYDPETLLEEYYAADGTSSADKINSMRRMRYASNKDRINAQKRAAYKLRTSLKSGNIGEKAVPYSQRGIDLPETTQKILSAAEKPGEQFVAESGGVKDDDVRAATVETGVEFAKVSVGGKEIIIRGDDRGVTLTDEVISEMAENGGTLDFHCHPYIGDIMPSEEDQRMMALLEERTGQKSSRIISPDGRFSEFTKSGIINTGELSSSLTEQEKEAVARLFGE